LIHLALETTGCSPIQAPVVPPTAFIFNSFGAPLDTDFQATILGKKRGEASAISILGIIAVGDASAHKAAQNAAITTIRSADYEYMSILGPLFTQYTTVVYGD
jgi:hypothetical protein